MCNASIFLACSIVAGTETVVDGLLALLHEGVDS